MVTTLILLIIFILKYNCIMSLNFSLELSNNDISNLCKKLGIQLNGIYARNGVPSIFKNGNYVINLDNKSGSGTHWVCFSKVGKTIYYVDSFGMPPPEDELKCFKEHDTIHYNKKQIQNMKSILYGYFSVGFFLFQKVNKNKNMKDVITNYTKFFKTKTSDNTLEKYIMQYYNE